MAAAAPPAGTEPEVAALLAAWLGLGRMLRPLCRMLGLPPVPGVAAPPRCRAAGAPAVPRAPRVRLRGRDTLFRLRMGRPLIEV